MFCPNLRPLALDVQEDIRELVSWPGITDCTNKEAALVSSLNSFDRVFQAGTKEESKTTIATALKTLKTIAVDEPKGWPIGPDGYPSATRVAVVLRKLKDCLETIEYA